MTTPREHSSLDSYDYGSHPSYQRRKEVPKVKGRWQHVEQKPFPYVPDLPESPTAQQRAEHQAALAEWVQTRFHNVGWEWIPDSDPQLESEAQPLATTERERPPMRALPRSSSKPPKMNIRKHESHCSVCRHPDRDAIEEEFIHWFSPRATAKDYDIDVRAIYRHAHAFNLFTVRNRKIRFVLSHALERAEHAAPPTAADLNRMVRTFTRLTDDGEWIEPPAHVIVSSGRQIPLSNAPASHPPPAAPEPESNIESGSDSGSELGSQPSNGKPSFSTRRAGKNSPQLPENNQNASAFLDTQNRSSSSPKSPGGFTFARGPFPHLET